MPALPVPLRPRRAALLLGALAAACGRAPEPALGLRPLELSPAVELPAGDEAPRSALLRPPAGIEPWTVYGRAQLGAPPDLPGAEHLPEGLYLFGRGPKNVLVPGPFEPADFNRVAVTLLVKVHSVLEVQVLRGGEPVLSSGPLRVWSSDRPQRVVADLPRAPFVAEPADTLRVRLARDAGPVCIASIELIAQPLRGWLGAPGGAPRLRSASGDQRGAALLTSEVPLSARFVPGARDRLAFSCALPAELRFEGQRPRLRVSLRADGAEASTRELALEPSPDEPARWHPAELELARFAGRALEARFELLVDGERPGFAFVAEPRLYAPRSAAPAVVLVTSDTHRADHVGAAPGAAEVRTPALDALAARGLLFERCWSTSNVTVPSHVAMLTGLHPRDTGVLDNITTLEREAETLAEAFRAAGFRTFAAVSAYHLSDELSGLGQGFDRLSAPLGRERRADATCAVARAWLDESAGEPLFLWLHLFDAHGPYEPPPEFAEPYRSELAAAGAPEDDLLQARARYRGEVSWLDAQLGALLAHPRLKEAVIAVTADHGECLGQHGIYYAHAGLYTDTVHVPLVLAWPGAPAGRRVERPVQNHELGRTLLDLAGLEARPFPGRSLIDEARADEPLFALASSGDQAAVTADGWHLILHLRADPARGWARHELELFRLADDPGCERDLAAEEPKRARGLRRALVRWLRAPERAGLASEARVDAELRAHLEALGYAAQDAAASGAWIDPDCACAPCARYR